MVDLDIYQEDAIHNGFAEALLVYMLVKHLIRNKS